MKAKAALLTEGGGPFRIESIDIEEPRADEVLVAIKAVGICHTDLVFASGAMGIRMPMILGHEGAGIVESVGSAITKAKAGDKVLLTFDSCGRCMRCAANEPAYCLSFPLLNFAGVREDGSSPARYDGAAVSARFFGQSSFATHAIVHERNLIVVDDDADLATLAPLGCGIQTGVGGVTRSLAAAPGSTLVVIGGGAVGLSGVMGGVLAGCGTIILIEPRPERRALGLELGAHHAIDPGTGDMAAAVRSIVPAGVDNVFDTSGVVDMQSAAMKMLAPRGTLGLVGVPPSLDAVLPLPIVAAITFGLSVRGIIEGDSVPDEFLPELIALHKDGKLPFDRFTRHYRFEDINTAISDAHSGKCIKAVLVI